MKIKLFLFVFVVSLSPFVQSAVEDEDIVGYDDIVKELSATPSPTSTSRTRWSSSSSSLDNVLLHGGVAFTNMFGSLVIGSNRTVYLNQKGVQANMGIDLLSRTWIVEGSVRSFSPHNYGETNVALKEFDLKLLYKPKLADSLVLKFGGGVSARYLHVQDSVAGTQDYTTPSSVAVAGFDIFLSPILSLGVESSIRTALIDETQDRQSYDGSLRLDAHF